MEPKKRWDGYASFSYLGGNVVRALREVWV